MRVVLIQLAVNDTEDLSGRFQRAEQLLRTIEEANRNQKEAYSKPDLILFPELWGCGFQNFSAYQEEAEELKGRTWAFMSSWAKRLHCWIHGGSFVEKQKSFTESGEKTDFYNTSVLFDRAGCDTGIYRKIHLFGFESMEQKILTAGNLITELETEFGRTGMTTCYDLRFPEQFRVQTVQVPQLFLVTAAWPGARLGHWRLFNQVRAVENQCYVISCNAAGTQCGVVGGGHSMVTDPWGHVLAEGSDGEEIIWCDLDLNRVSECREQFPALKDRKSLQRTGEGGNQ